MEITLKVKPREEKGKGPARRARSAGQVPGVLYGRGLDPVPVYVEDRELHRVLTTEAGLNVLINLRLDSKTEFLTMLREVQRSPLRGDLLHVDFVKIDRDIKIEAEVPIHLIGESRGVKEGGVVEHHLWELKVEALPGDVPPHVEVNIARLGLNEHLRVSDLAEMPGVEILSPEEEIVVSVVEPQVIQLPEEIAAEEAAAEAAAAAEGEEGAEGEAAEGEAASEEKPSE
jgi:large subunit ribosomal protein L25